MKLRLMVALAAGAWLAAVPVAGQAVRGAGQSGGIRFTTPPPAPPPAPTASPVTPPPQGPPPRRDLFLAGPDTYAPRYDHLNQSLYFPGAVGFVGYPGSVDPSRSTTTVIFAQPPAAAPAAAPAPVAPPPPPAPKKTFYVITGCYAGDTPPTADVLRPGCSLAALRRIDPR
jgi:hypothetical protein